MNALLKNIQKWLLTIPNTNWSSEGSEKLESTMWSNEVAQYVENQGFDKWFSEHFADRNANAAKWNLREVFNKPQEFRSRMAATLDYLRNKGYNTSELIQNPSKFKDWINELRTKKINVPYDLNHLL